MQISTNNRSKQSKGLLMAEEKKKPIKVKIDENSFELSLRILSNEFVAIKIGSTNFSGKLIAGGILLLFFTLILLEGFGLNELLMQ
jgi:hypothetical protein